MNHELIRDSEIYLDALGFSVAVITRDGTIVHTNLQWWQFMEHNGGCAVNCDVHSNYLEVSRVDELSYNNISGVLSGTLPAASWDYTCHAPSEKRWFMAIASPLIDKHANLIGATISHVDVSTRKTSELLLHNCLHRSVDSNTKSALFIRLRKNHFGTSRPQRSYRSMHLRGLRQLQAHQRFQWSLNGRCCP